MSVVAYPTNMIILLMILAINYCEANYLNTCASSKNYINQCVANCLDLSDFENSPCNFDKKYGHATGVKCSDNFTNSVKNDKMLFCDFPTGLSEPEEISLMNMCDIICFSQFIQFDNHAKKLQLNNNSHKTFLRIKEVAQQFGVKVIARIGSNDDEVMSFENLSRETSTPEKRVKLENQLTYFLDTYGLDGYVLHWLAPGCPNKACSSTNLKDQSRFVPFVQNLGEKLKAKGKTFILFTLTTDTAVNFFIGDYYSNITQVVDYFAMEVSFQSDMLNPVVKLGSSLQVALAHVREFCQKVAEKSTKRKLILGFNPMTLNFKLSSKKLNTLGSPHTYHVDQYLTQGRVCKYLRDENYTKVLNSSTQNYAFSSSYLFSYDDVESMREKVQQLVFDLSLAGAGIQTQFDDLRGECGCGSFPYTRMIANVLKRPQCTVDNCF